VKYFHRTSVDPDAVMAKAAEYFGQRLSSVRSEVRTAAWKGAIGALSVHVMKEGGHYTLVTVETDQVGESEIDKLGKRFLTLVHTLAEPAHRPIGAY
jgi:hypothetical protein